MIILHPNLGSMQSLKGALQSYVTSISAFTAATPPAASTSAKTNADEPEGPSEAARNILANIGKTTRAAIRAGEDKVGLAVTLYEAVSLFKPE